jgi:hypothetical protein
MRRIKEVLRLRYELGLGQRQIARSCSIGQSTVYDYLKRAEAADVRWPLPEDWDDERLERSLFVYGEHQQRQPQRSQPDFGSIHEQLKRHSNLTLALLWEKYRQVQPDGYRYSRFCELYQRWRRKQEVVLRREHKAGEKVFVDWAGDTVPIYDPKRRTGATGASICRGFGSQFLHLRRGHIGRAVGELDRSLIAISTRPLTFASGPMFPTWQSPQIQTGGVAWNSLPTWSQS